MDELINLTKEDLLVEYKKLLDRYDQLQITCEENAQRIYELKRSLETSQAAEAYLTQELEQISTTSDTIRKSSENKLQSELDDLRRKYGKEYASLQQEYEDLLEENAQLCSKLENSEKITEKSVHIDTKSDYDQKLNQMEHENLILMEKLADFEENAIRNTMEIAEKDKNLELLQDELTCLKENMHYKREELEEKTELLESTQEQLAEANSKIENLISAPETDGRKGNSLFAEVDDQRQVMRQLLSVQKISYMQMKKIYDESQYEIRRLRNENIAMHNELKTCSDIFKSADKVYQMKLNKRIFDLLNQNEELERQLTLAEDRLKELANKHGVSWLDSMLSFCKYETGDLKQQLRATRIQLATSDEQVRNCKQELAGWRFEALKFRCLLLDRENILNEHKIPFKNFEDLQSNLIDEQLQLPKQPSVSAAISDRDKVITDSKRDDDDVVLKSANFKEEEIRIPNFASDKNTTRFLLPGKGKIETFNEENLEEINNISDSEIKSLDLDETSLKDCNETQTKENQSCCHKENFINNDHSLISEVSQQQEFSISYQQPDISTSKPNTVLKYSPKPGQVNISMETTPSANESMGVLIESNKSNDSNAIPKQARKTNIVVRHFVINRKKEAVEHP